MSDKPYILGQVIARGGMAEVYRGLHVGQDGFRRLIAIKRILPHNAQNAEYAEMFKDEAHIGQRLQHANIVKVEGFDVIEGSPSIIMEFVDGSDMRTLLSAIEHEKNRKSRFSINESPSPNAASVQDPSSAATQTKSDGKNSGRLPIEICIYIAAEAARGLHYAHLRKDDITGRPLHIVHRDISPQNILISWDGEVKVTDFGIASADRDFKQTETKVGIVKGKYSYMSPEQISGKKCDARSDVFSLCVVLWEAIAMRRLFASENEIDVIEMVRYCKIPMRLRDANSLVSDELEAIVVKGLNKDPRRRYESMEDLEKTLRLYLSNSPTQVTASDISSYLKIILADRRALSDDEKRKILTTAQLPIVSASSSSNKKSAAPQNLEISVGQGVVSQSPSGLRIAPHRPIGPMSSSTPQSRIPDHFSGGRNRDRPSPRWPSSSAKKNKKSNVLQVAAFTILCSASLFGLTIFKNYRSAAKQALTVVIKSQVEPIRIKINDRDHAGGHFVSSPAKVRLEPGLNKIEISRPGYNSEKVLVNTEDSASKSLPLIRLKPMTAFTPVRINYHGKEAVMLTINDGFFRQTLTPGQPSAIISDLTSGITADLVVASSLSSVLIHCQFIPTSAATNHHPIIVEVDEAKASCEIKDAKEPKP